MLDEIYCDLDDRMKKAVETLESENKKLRTGRASISLVDGIRVDYYGTATPLSQLATLTSTRSAYDSDSAMGHFGGWRN